MNTVKFTIDGRQVQAQAGQTVLQAALAAGIDIPHLCYHPVLPPFAGCRLCIVEIKGGRAPLASCALPIKEGMEVIAHNQKLFNYRKTILDLILSDHPSNCMTCESNGVCDLQKYIYEYGLETTSYEGERTSYPNETGNPLIEMSHQTCIMCGRCVLACQSATVNNAIDFTQRSFATKITTPMDIPRKDSDCTFCGACVDVCPVGALTDKTARFRGRHIDCTQTAVICPYCGCGCSILLDIKDNKIIRTYGNPEGLANKGLGCIKGHFGLDFVHHPDRLGKPLKEIPNPKSQAPNKSQIPISNSQLPEYPSCALDDSLKQSRQRLNKPLIRKDGGLTEATWDEAIKLIVQKFAAIKKEHGSEALATLASAKCSNEENYLMQKFCRVLFGNNNVDHCARLCHASTVAGLARSFGSAAMTNSIDEIENTQAMLVIGSNTTEAHPIIGYAIKRAVNKGAKLIVCDPRGIELTQFSDVWLQQRNGTDVALINGLMHVIIKEGLADEEFIKSRTEDFETCKKVVEEYPPEKVAKITGVSAEDIRTAARLYAGAKSAMIFYSMGITQHTTGTDNCLSLANLAMLTGNLGRESTGVNPLRGQSNVQGACDLGALPNLYPGYQKVDDPTIKEKFEKGWGMPLSDKPGLTVTEIIDAAGEKKIKGLYIMGENPMISDPNITHVDEALKQLDFLVVQDMFLTETAQRATVVLPACSFAEKQGTYTNTERRVQLSPAALKVGEGLAERQRSPDPIGVPSRTEGPKTDWQILSEIGTRLAKELNINTKFNYQSPSEIMDEIALLSPIYGGISYDRLKPSRTPNSELPAPNSKLLAPNSELQTPNSFQWPCPTKDHPGTKFLHKDKFTRGLGKFHPVEYKPPAEEPDKDYPFILSTGRSLYHFHTGSMSRRSTGPAFVVPEAYVEIHPIDAAKLKIKDGDKVNVTSRRGSIEIKAKVTEQVAIGSVFIPFHFAEAAANMLTNPALDPIAKIPEYKVCAVRVTK